MQVVISREIRKVVVVLPAISLTFSQSLERILHCLDPSNKQLVQCDDRCFLGKIPSIHIDVLVLVCILDVSKRLRLTRTCYSTPIRIRACLA
jgi:hypothetical protein